MGPAGQCFQLRLHRYFVDRQYHLVFGSTIGTKTGNVRSMMIMKREIQIMKKEDAINIESLRAGRYVQESGNANIETTPDMAGEYREKSERLDQARVWEMLEGLMRNLKEVDTFLKAHQSGSAREKFLESLEWYQKAVDRNLRNEPAEAYGCIKTASAAVWRALTLTRRHELQGMDEI